MLHIGYVTINFLQSLFTSNSESVNMPDTNIHMFCMLHKIELLDVRQDL